MREAAAAAAETSGPNAGFVVVLLAVAVGFAAFVAIRSAAVEAKAGAVEDRSLWIMDGAHAIFSWMGAFSCNGTAPVFPMWTEAECAQLQASIAHGGRR